MKNWYDSKSYEESLLNYKINLINLKKSSVNFEAQTESYKL